MASTLLKLCYSTEKALLINPINFSLSRSDSQSIERGSKLHEQIRLQEEIQQLLPVFAKVFAFLEKTRLRRNRKHLQISFAVATACLVV